jgi:hypothetical protein
VSLRPKFSKAEWIILIVTAAMLSMVVFTGCFRGSVPPGNAPGIHGPAAIVGRVGAIAIWLGSIGLIACAALAYFYPNKFTVAKLAITCGTLIAGGTLVVYLGQHLWAFIGLGVLAGVGWWCYRHVGRIEMALGKDLNQDGKVG